jgi:transposase
MVDANPPMQQAMSPEAASSRPSDDDVLRYLSEHSEGLPIAEMEKHFSIPHSRAEDIVNHLLGEQRVRKDDKRQVLLPA